MAEKESELKKKETKKCDNCIFSQENVNIGHQHEFDYLKTVGVFSFGIFHVYTIYSYGSLLGLVDLFRLTLTAGGLMILMGMGMKYTRHHEPKDYISRGITLLSISQLFYLLKDSIPCLIALWVTGDKFYLSLAMLVLQVDILSFSGLAFLLMGFFKKMKLSDVSIMIIGIIMNCLHYYLDTMKKSPKNYLLSQILGFFVLTDAETYFPLFSYFIFPAFGNWMGNYYLKLSNKNKFYNYILVLCLPIVIIYHYLRIQNKIPMLPEYGSIEYLFLSPFTDGIICCMTNIVSLAIFYKIDMMFKGKTPEVIRHMGKNMNQYYIISYLFTVHISTFLRITRGIEYPSKIKYPTLIGFMALIVSRILIDINDRYIHFGITTLKNPIRNIVFALVWITSIIIVFCIYPKIDTFATFWNDYLH